MTEIEHPLPYGTVVRAGPSSLTKPGESGLHMIVAYDPANGYNLPYWVISFDDYNLGMISSDYFNDDPWRGWSVVELP